MLSSGTECAARPRKALRMGRERGLKNQDAKGESVSCDLVVKDHFLQQQQQQERQVLSERLPNINSDK